MWFTNSSLSAITCSKPNITQAQITPSSNFIAFNEEYNVTCNTGYKISGNDKMKCGGNGFDQTPVCIGKTATILDCIDCLNRLAFNFVPVNSNF